MRSACSARMAEVYAGFLSHADNEIGRLLDYLEESEQLENTMIVLVSDNGASGEGGPNGSVNENKIFNGLPDKIEEALPFIDELGSPRTYNHYPTGWACAFNTPVQALEAVRQLGGRHRRSDDRLLAEADSPAGRAPPVHARRGHRADDLRSVWDRAAGGREGIHPVPDRGCQLRRHLRRRRCQDRERDAVLFDGRHARRSGIRAGRQRPSPPRRRTTGRGTSPSAGSCSTPTAIRPSATTSPSSTPRSSRV